MISHWIRSDLISYDVIFDLILSDIMWYQIADPISCDNRSKHIDLISHDIRSKPNDLTSYDIRSSSVDLISCDIRWYQIDGINLISHDIIPDPIWYHVSDRIGSDVISCNIRRDLINLISFDVRSDPIYLVSNDIRSNWIRCDIMWYQICKSIVVGERHDVVWNRNER